MILSAITQPLNAELRKTENAVRKTGKEPVRTAPSDRTEFSKDGQNLSKTGSASALAAVINAQPDVRLDKVAEVKAKIERGYYNSPEFTDSLAEKLLAEVGIKAPK
ncbi:MAG: flagellar biosynthesis anti-sigma factor FlgM [Chitinispirillaceae bacterium]|jgi:anti-sigma28 factor (negative regulator of flagellin synthesis)|nr:flagellar biosynthesis anti-sigma factor FlgM [Chitinispirillaceae bacterium]